MNNQKFEHRKIQQPESEIEIIAFQNTYITFLKKENSKLEFKIGTLQSDLSEKEDEITELKKRLKKLEKLSPEELKELKKAEAYSLLGRTLQIEREKKNKAVNELVDLKIKLHKEAC